MSFADSPTACSNVSRRLPQENMRLALSPQIAKRMRSAFVEAGQAETLARAASEKFETVLLPKDEQGPDNVQQAA